MKSQRVYIDEKNDRIYSRIEGYGEYGIPELIRDLKSNRLEDSLLYYKDTGVFKELNLEGKVICDEKHLKEEVGEIVREMEQAEKLNHFNSWKNVFSNGSSQEIKNLLDEMASEITHPYAVEFSEKDDPKTSVIKMERHLSEWHSMGAMPETKVEHAHLMIDAFITSHVEKSVPGGYKVEYNLEAGNLKVLNRKKQEVSSLSWNKMKMENVDEFVSGINGNKSRDVSIEM